MSFGKAKFLGDAMRVISRRLGELRKTKSNQKAINELAECHDLILELSRRPYRGDPYEVALNRMAGCADTGPENERGRSWFANDGIDCCRANTHNREPKMAPHSAASVPGTYPRPHPGHSAATPGPVAL